MTVEVAVNLTWCRAGQVGGSEEYLARQMAGWTELPPADVADLRLVLYVAPSFAAGHPDLAGALAMRTMPLAGDRRPLRVAAESTWLAWATRRAGLAHHGGGTMPAIATQPSVVTIHDLQYRQFPQYFSTVKRRFLATTVPRSARRATVIAVPSEFVRSTVIDAFAIDPARVVVVPHGIEAAIGAEATPEDELRARWGLGDRPVVVFPAMTHPHKNHRFLVRLMAREWRERDLVLVLPGGSGLADGDVAGEIAASGVGDRIVRLGRVSPADRDGLVRMAAALVFPSEYEGFGAPVLEAMALGTPVISSDRASLPEVVGDAGLVLPLDPAAWAGALDEVAARRDELVAAGRERARRFTARASAAALARAYRVALAAHR